MAIVVFWGGSCAAYGGWTALIDIGYPDPGGPWTKAGRFGCWYTTVGMYGLVVELPLWRVWFGVEPIADDAGYVACMLVPSPVPMTEDDRSRDFVSDVCEESGVVRMKASLRSVWGDGGDGAIAGYCA